MAGVPLLGFLVTLCRLCTLPPRGVRGPIAVKQLGNVCLWVSLCVCLCVCLCVMVRRVRMLVSVKVHLSSIVQCCTWLITYDDIYMNCPRSSILTYCTSVSCCCLKGKERKESRRKGKGEEGRKPMPKWGGIFKNLNGQKGKLHFSDWNC